MKLTVMIICTAGMFLSSSVFAATIRVPADQPTIQMGIDAAVDGDTVLVADGTYTGDGNRDIDFKGKAITVTSENGPEACIIDCQGTQKEIHRGFYFDQGETNESVVSGFTIMNGYVMWDGSTYESGGGIYCRLSSPTITNCVFFGNRADDPGGSPLGGGGVYLENCSNSTISNCTFSENVADHLGGGIACYFSPNLTISNCIFTKNSADSGGGIYLDYNSNSTISNCIFIENAASGSGGGICDNSYSSTSIFNCSFEGNISFFFGGGIAFLASHPTVSNCTFSDNRTTAAEGGGGIFCQSDHFVVTRCAFTGNTAYDWGGGIWLRCSDHSTITNCTFSGNGGTVFGGGIFLEGCSDSTIINCTFATNRAGMGSGMYFDESDHSTITNCTFTGNTAYFDSGVIDSWLSSNLSISNCILWKDHPSEIDFDETPPAITYSLIQGGYPGIGNIEAEPLFLGEDILDFHLAPNSLCIDAGTDVGAPAIDMDGNPRPNAGAVDMGAYEYQGWPSLTRAYITMPTHSFIPGVSASCSVSVWNAGTSIMKEYPLFVMLDVFGSYYCAPSFSEFDHYDWTFFPGLTELTVLPEFIWPDNVGTETGIVWYAFLMNPDMTELTSEIGVFDFGWSE